MSRKFFFTSTNDAAASMTELFDFVWPAVTSFVHARSKSHRHRNLKSEDQRSALEKAFLSNRVLRKEYRSISGLKRASLGKAFVQTKWSDQEQVFARLVLVNIFAIHEGWLDDLMEELLQTKNPKITWTKKAFSDATQFPFANSKHQNWTWAMRELGSLRSPDMDAGFGLLLRKRRYYLTNQGQDYVVCYRYFKELRNAVIHRGGAVTQHLMNSQQSFATIASNFPQFGGVTSPGTLQPLSPGQQLELSLYGVVGFNDVVLRLIATLDAEAAVTEMGEAELARFFSNRSIARSASGQRDATLRRMADNFGFPGLTNTSAFEKVLKRTGISIP